MIVIRYLYGSPHRIKAADEGPADEQDSFLLVRNVTLMPHIVCDIRATNVGILRQSYREDTWRPLA